VAIILNINTAFETALVSLSSGEEIIIEAQSNSQKNHSSFLEPAIKKLCTEAQLELNTIDAVCVVNGPGSYTGLRVGLSSAKALCYALNKPLILLNTLDVMAYALKQQSLVPQQNFLICPMIDARRMEVYTALYDSGLHLIKPYSSEILNNSFLEEERQTNIIIAGGNGSIKLKEIISDNSIAYTNALSLSKPTVILSDEAFSRKDFSQIAYSEPFYLKPVYFRK
jgi:tRNA threonylcarbamoyladenosine biosynthesis protein TsaB